MAIQDGYCICFNEWFLDKRISSDLQLLCLIASLCAKEGYCYADNEYLAKVLEITEVSVSRKLKNLADCGHIDISYKMSGSRVESREIRLTKMLTGRYQNCYRAVNKNVKDNNINNNNTREKEKLKKEKVESFGEYEPLRPVIERWLEYKKSRKESYKSLQSIMILAKKLGKLSGNDISVANEIVDQSIGNNWSGLFALQRNERRQTEKERRAAERDAELEAWVKGEWHG